MSDRVTSEKHVGTVTVNARRVDIVRSAWRDSTGLSYDVYDTATGRCLTEEESFDGYPTTAQLASLLED
jgi:hypothetical protein